MLSVLASIVCMIHAVQVDNEPENNEARAHFCSQQIVPCISEITALTRLKMSAMMSTLVREQ